MKKDEERDRREKEIEHVRWDYLMQSDKFMRLWQIWRERIKRGSINDPTVPIPDELMFIDCQYRISHLFKFNVGKDPYFFCHDPSEANFEDYWKYRKSRIEELERYNLVDDFTPILARYIDAVATILRKDSRGKEPSIEGLKNYLVNSLMKNSRQIYLAITQLFFTHKEADKIIKLVSHKIRKRIPDRRFKADELRRYLDVYKLRKPGINRMKYKEIFEKKLIPHYRNHTWDVARIELINDYRKAKKIMSNIETDKDLRFYW